MKHSHHSTSMMAKGELFSIYLKTGKKRLLLTIVSGGLIFLTIVSLVMIVYTHRFQSFQRFQEEHVNWSDDGFISVSSNQIKSGLLDFGSDYLTNLTTDFSTLTTSLIPRVRVVNSTTAMSVQINEFNSSIPGEPWLTHELMTVDDVAFTVVGSCLVAGRLPRNSSELLWVKNNETTISLNETRLYYSITELNSDPLNYTIVGIVDNLDAAFIEAGLSADVFHWSFDNLAFYNYHGINRFLTNYSLFNTVTHEMGTFYGVVTHLVDFTYDLTDLKLNALIKYLQLFPKSNDLAISPFLNSLVELCPDLKDLIVKFSDFWVEETIKILSINSPLFLIVGLLSVVALNIGSKDLSNAFRKMKLYGISFTLIQRFIFLENLLLTSVSTIGGVCLGFFIGFLSTRHVQAEHLPFFRGFLTEPLLFITLITFIGAFFALSIYIQHSIAKKTTETISEEYQKKRRKIRNLFSTNEFRLIIIALFFSLVSVLLFVGYNQNQSAGSITSSLSYLTLLYFMISCSIAFLLTFTFLIIARLNALFWSVLTNYLWKRRQNMAVLSMKHLVAQRDIFQVAVLGALIFGTVILPGVAMSRSLDVNTKKEAVLAMGGVNIAIMHWVDPSDELDAYLNNISEIRAYTEVTIFKLKESNEEFTFPFSFTINYIGLEDPTTFIDVVDLSQAADITVNKEDVLALEEDMTVLMDRSFARKNKLTSGAAFSTATFTRFALTNLTFINSFDIFPLVPLPKKPLISKDYEVFSLISNRETARDIVGNVAFSTEVASNTVKLIQPVNESAIPTVLSKLAALNLSAISYNQLLNEMSLNIDTFTQNNLFFFSILSSLLLVFVGFFTSIRIFDERKRIIDSLYRVGARKQQLIGYFSLEHVLINSLPLLLAILSSLFLVKVLALNFLGAKEYYYPYHPGIPWWLFLLVFLLGQALLLVGWLAVLFPAIYRFKVEKQE
ncbi:MAG: FtsX-like permease family protein [Candidatus Heimdallarchaeota archaeon]